MADSFNDDGKLELFHIQTNLWKITSVLYVEFTEIILKIKYANKLFVSIFFK